VCVSICVDLLHLPEVEMESGAEAGAGAGTGACPGNRARYGVTLIAAHI